MTSFFLFEPALDFTLLLNLVPSVRSSGKTFILRCLRLPRFLLLGPARTGVLPWNVFRGVNRHSSVKGLLRASVYETRRESIGHDDSLVYVTSQVSIDDTLT